MTEKMIIGSLEACSLPELEISDLQIRIDTGAKTSSLHVDNIEYMEKNGKPFVKFDIHPDIHNVDRIVRRQAPVSDIRKIKSSNGESEKRYVITTEFHLGDKSWPIEISLSDRSDMTYLMLFGREGMGDKVLVDPSQTFIVSSGSEVSD